MKTKSDVDQWLIENSHWLNFSGLEQRLKMPKNTLHKAVHGGGIPAKYHERIRAFFSVSVPNSVPKINAENL